MGDRELKLGPGECSGIETGARFFSALAFPGEAEEAAQKAAELAWAGQYLREANRVDESSIPFKDPRLNELMQADPAWCRAAVRTARRRLRDRMAAARSVRPWIGEALSETELAIAGIPKLSQRQIALYLKGGDVEDADNFQKNVLRPSRPVLHLAVSIDLYGAVLGESKTSCEIDLLHTERLDRLVRLSNVVKRHMCADKRFRVTEEDLLHLVWIE